MALNRYIEHLILLKPTYISCSPKPKNAGYTIIHMLPPLLKGILNLLILLSPIFLDYRYFPVLTDKHELHIWILQVKIHKNKMIRKTFFDPT